MSTPFDSRVELDWMDSHSGACDGTCDEPVKAIVYSEAAGPAVLRVAHRPIPEPGSGEVRVRVQVSGVNPTDWKARRAGGGRVPFPEYVPNQDGAGVIDSVGEGVSAARIGEPVWLWEAAWLRAGGRGGEHGVRAGRHGGRLPDGGRAAGRCRTGRE